MTHRGAWPGNDTIWRMVADLYEGMQLKKRNYFTVIDGIIGGEGQGPFCPTSKCSSTLIASNNLLYADIVASRYMGFDPKKIKYLEHFIKRNNWIWTMIFKSFVMEIIWNISFLLKQDTRISMSHLCGKKLSGQETRNKSDNSLFQKTITADWEAILINAT